MAQVRNNIIMQGLNGMSSSQLPTRQNKRATDIRLRSHTRRVLSETQKQHHDHFREAIVYAQSACGAEIYISKADGTPMTSYSVALADWFHAPEILEIDLGNWSGQPAKVIRIKALDDVLVTQVNIRIQGAGGVLLEQGPATRVDELWWEYATRSTGCGRLTVLASAQDMPGNVTEMSKVSGV